MKWANVGPLIRSGFLFWSLRSGFFWVKIVKICCFLVKICFFGQRSRSVLIGPFGLTKKNLDHLEVFTTFGLKLKPTRCTPFFDQKIDKTFMTPQKRQIYMQLWKVFVQGFSLNFWWHTFLQNGTANLSLDTLQGKI